MSPSKVDPTVVADRLAWARRMRDGAQRLVHLYHDVAPEELHEICRVHMADVERVAVAVEAWLRAHPERLARR